MPRVSAILGQLRNTGTSAENLYSPAENKRGIVKQIIVCNNTASTAAYRIFVDKEGGNYTEDTAIFYDVDLPANSTHILDVTLPMMTKSSVGARSDTANSITFTCTGDEFS